MNQRIFLRVFCLTGIMLLTSAVNDLHAADAGIVSGPMPGMSATRQVSVWLQTNGGKEAAIEYWPVNDKNNVSRSKRFQLSEQAQHTARLELTDLQPGTRYQYRVLIDNKRQDTGRPLYFQTQALWQWREAPPDFKVALGSCAYINESAYDRPGKPYGAGFEIFDAIAEQQPDMMLWLGDNIYFRESDFDGPWGMAERYKHDRALPALQKLLRATHHYATWDDHDFGPNNANSSFIFKQNALALFRRYWANPSYGLPETPGVFTKVEYNDVDFFLLDGRYYRNGDRAPNTPDKALFGKEQIAWLKDALLQSKGDTNVSFRIIVGGGQFLNDYSPPEGWNHYPDERDAFLKWLATVKIPGIIFLSGDKHRTELLKYERENAYTLYELTCSPLTAGTYDVSEEEKKPNVVPGTVLGQRNFCRMDFSGSINKRKLAISVFNSAGERLWTHALSVDALK